MSWLKKTVNTGFSSLSGQLKDILAENTDDVVDTATELKQVKEKFKENERHNEFLKNECKRLNEDLNEAILRSEALEIQLETLNTNSRNHISEKDSVIFDLRKEITLLQQQQQQNNMQQSTDMNYFEEIMPSSELNDYIRLQKEINRLQDENKLLYDENHKLLKQQQSTNLASKFKEIKINDDSLLDDYEEINTDSSNNNVSSQKNAAQMNSLKQKVESLEKEIYELNIRIKIEHDKHQEEIKSIQETYKEKLHQTYETHKREIERLNKEKDDLASWKDGWNTLDDEDPIKTSTTTISSSQDAEVQHLTNEIERLRKDIEKSEIEIDESSQTIDNLNIELKKTNETLRKEVLQKIEAEKELKSNQVKLNEYIERNESLNSSLDKEKELNKINEQKLDECQIEYTQLLAEMEKKEEKLKELEERLNNNLSLTTTPQETNFDELNETIRTLKSSETKLKYQLENELSVLNKEIEVTREENLNLNRNLNEKEKEKTQYLTILDEKNEECLNLQREINNLNDKISDLSNQNRLDRSEESRIIMSELDEKNNEISLLQQTQIQQDQAYNELNIAYNNLQHERTQLYFYLNQKSDESLNYYNEIQRLNETILSLNQELLKIKEEYLNLENELNQENKLVEDLNSETENLRFELQKKAQQQNVECKVASTETEGTISVEELESKLLIIDQKDFEINQMKTELENLGVELKKTNEKLTSSQLDLKRITSERDQSLMSLKEKEYDLQRLSDQATLSLKEKDSELKRLTDQSTASLREKDLELKRLADQANEQIIKLNRDLERLREHLVEVSDSYNNEAIQAEAREKELRTLLSQAEENISNQNSNIVNSNKEMHKRVQELTYENEDLKEEKQRLISQLKQVEDSYQNQIKVTKNLELVLDRLQKEKDIQHNNEILKYQDTIKQNAIALLNCQKDLSNYQAQISELKEVVSAASRLNEQLERKDETISYLQQQIQTKESLVLTLETKINEVQKVNENYIEKDIIKNLLIGYLKVNTNERKQVLKLIGSMLNFQPHDYEQIEQTSLSSKWLSGMFTGSASKSSSPNKGDDLNKSFTELLIQYVDRESKPIPRVSLDLGQQQQQSAGSLLLSKQQQQLNSGLLITNKKNDNQLFYSAPPLSHQQIFNPTLNRSNPFSINTPQQPSSGISSQTSDYAILQSNTNFNLSNRFTPSPSTSSQQTTLSSNNNTFLEDALNK